MSADVNAFSEAERAILAARTRALARPDAAPCDAAALEVIYVRAGGDTYALPLTAVRAVAELRHLTPVPHATADVAGLTARGASVVPVFHLRVVLGLPLAELPEHGRMVLVGSDDDPAGLVVDAISGVGVVNPATLAEPPATVTAATRAWLRGVTPELVPLVDLDALVASDRLVLATSFSPTPVAPRSNRT